LTLSLQSETVEQVSDVGRVGKMRSGKPAIWVGLSAGLSVTLAVAFSPLAAGAQAQTAPQVTRTAQASVAIEPQPARAPRRLRIYPRYQAEPDGVYPRYNPGPNAVRVCNATYAQEYRPSGTVIVPHMTCVWRRG
jgi:hypothetical protein